MKKILLRLTNKTLSFFNILIIRHIKIDKSAILTNYYRSTFFYCKRSKIESEINKIAEQTNSLGSFKLWSGYHGSNYGPTRAPNKVRTTPLVGSFYLDLTTKLRPEIIIEIGTAFGVSGMYFLAAIERNKCGKLITFEPNDVWIKYARQNLSKICSSFKSIMGEFELLADEHIENNSSKLIFIDGIHERSFVKKQLDIALQKLQRGAIIILDDINFSEDFNDYWLELSLDNRFKSSIQVGNRVGILELA
jgi:hypothetical protein